MSSGTKNMVSEFVIPIIKYVPVIQGGTMAQMKKNTCSLTSINFSKWVPL